MPRYARADGRLDIKSLTLPALEEEMAGIGSEKFRALQVYKWVWQRGARSFDEMTNIAKAARALLEERFYISWLECTGVL